LKKSKELLIKLSYYNAQSPDYFTNRYINNLYYP